MGDQFGVVDPGELYLPSGRQDGPDPSRYQSQVSQFAGETDGMPPILVTEGIGGSLRINNGVTRAVRVYRMSPGTAVPIEIVDVRPKADFSRLKRVREL